MCVSAAGELDGPIGKRQALEAAVAASAALAAAAAVAHGNGMLTDNMALMSNGDGMHADALGNGV